MNDQIIYDWLVLVTGATCIKANQNGPRPSGSFLTWQVIAQPEEGQTSLTITSAGGNDVNIEYQTQSRVTVSVESWGPAGRTPLQKLISATHKLDPRKLLAASGVRLVRGGDIRDLTRIINTKFSSVYQVDLEFMSFMRDTGTETDWTFDTTTISGDLEDDDGTTYPVTVTAP